MIKINKKNTCLNICEVFFILLLSLFGGFSYASKSHVQVKTSFPNNIAIIDIGYIFSHSRVIQSLDNFLLEEEKKFYKKKKYEESILLNKQNDLQKRKKSMRKKDFEIKQKSLLELSFANKKSFDDKNALLRQIRKKAEDYVFHILKELVRMYAKEHNIALVVTTSDYQSVVLYAEEKINISKSILDMLNTKIIDINGFLVQFKFNTY